MFGLLICAFVGVSFSQGVYYSPYNQSSVNHTLWVVQNNTKTVWVPKNISQPVLVPYQPPGQVPVTQYQNAPSYPVQQPAYRQIPVSQYRGVPTYPVQSMPNNGKHNYSWGTPGYYDRLFYSTRVKRDSSFFRKVTLDVDFPPRNQRPMGTITSIQISDMMPIGDGGEVRLLRGGVGYLNVTIHFKSQRGKAFDFMVQLYGH